MNCILLLEKDFIDEKKTVAVLTGRRKEHITTVFRAKIGDEFKAGVVNGLLGTARISEMTSNSITMNVNLNQTPPIPLPLILIMALCRPKSLKKSIEAATSMGIKKIYIIESWRVEKSFWKSPLLNQESLLEHEYLGLEQAKDTILPVIEFRRRFKPFVEDEIPQIIKSSRAFVAHPYNAVPCPYNISSPITLAIGPEGGFIPYEVEMFQKNGFEPVTIGERILRVEFAIPTLVGRLV